MAETIIGTVCPPEYKMVNNGKILTYTRKPQEDELVGRDVDVQYGTLIRFYKKIGRNEECPCGSGKKYKKCCM